MYQNSPGLAIETVGTLGTDSLIQPLNPVFTDDNQNSTAQAKPNNANQSNAQGKDASGIQFQAPDKSPLPPSVEAVAPQGVVTPNQTPAPTTPGTPDLTQPTPPGTVTPPPTSTNPQDGPLGVVAPTTIQNPNLPPVDPKGSPTGVTPPPGWKPSEGEGEASPQDWNDFLRALEEVWKYARTLAQQAEKQQLEQNNSLGAPNELTAKVANQTAFLIDDYARKRLSDIDHKNVQDVLKFVDTWSDPKEKLEFLVNFAGMIMTDSNLRGSSMSLDQLAAFARKGSELKKSGGTWKPDERSNVSYDPGDIKQVLKNYVGGAEQYSPEYRARNNRELAINAAGFLVPGALGFLGKMFSRAAVAGSMASKAANPVDEILSFYHGTTKEYALNIRATGIDLARGRANTDFGQGFYLTQSYEHALSRAEQMVVILGDRGIISEGAEVLNFQVRASELTSLSGKVFAQANAEWSAFVVGNREGSLAMHGYDYVAGPVAKTWTGGSARAFPYPEYNQFSIHSSAAAKIFYKGLK